MQSMNWPMPTDAAAPTSFSSSAIDFADPIKAPGSPGLELRIGAVGDGGEALTPGATSPGNVGERTPATTAGQSSLLLSPGEDGDAGTPLQMRQLFDGDGLGAGLLAGMGAGTDMGGGDPMRVEGVLAAGLLDSPSNGRREGGESVRV